jgi:PIN domain nuclease of toxin-antitoxin system
VRLLLDSCSLIWYSTETSQFKPSVLEQIRDPLSDLFVSQASFIEIAGKAAAGRIKFAESFEAFVQKAIPEYSIKVLKIEFDDIFLTSRLPPHHKDPFDRLLIAQALRSDFVVVTPDPKFPPYGVKVLW